MNAYRHWWLYPLFLLLLAALWPVRELLPYGEYAWTIGILISMVLLAVVVHEVSHGAMARRCGDQTAAKRGRLTLNPFPHLSLLGSFVLPLTLVAIHAGFIFGAAKPVPVRVTRFRTHPRDQVLVALAGPVSNFILALGFLMLLAVCASAMAALDPGFDPAMLSLLRPDPFALPDYLGPLPALLVPLALAARFGVVINVALGGFNLIPIPPLDGGWVMRTLLGRGGAGVARFLQRWGLPIILMLLFMRAIIFFILPLIVQLVLLNWLLFGVWPTL